MRVGRSKRTATAVAAAIIGGLLGGAVPGAASAAPASPAAPFLPDVPVTPVTPVRPTTPSGPAADPAPATAPGRADRTDRTDRTAQGDVPSVWPRPQSLAATREPAVRLGTEVTLVAPPGTDPHAVSALRALLHASGVRTVHKKLPGRGPVLRLGTDEHPDADAALRALGARERGDLPAGGYRLATGRFAGRDTVALAGAGQDGLFHAVQTLRQLITRPGEGAKTKTGAKAGTETGAGAGAVVPGVTVRDWPTSAVRGLTEGFYGRPWSSAERLGQMDFLGRTKQNRYLYAPGDDPYRGALWREPYPTAERAAFRELAARAEANHVTLAWAVSPGQAMCLSSEEDLAALKKKTDAMWALGVRAFQLQFQDVSYSEWHCSGDADAFGRGPGAAARAHARVANALARHLAARHPGAAPLSLLPTEYYQDGATDYRTALAEALDARVEVAWTGVGVVPRTITGKELAGARDALRHPLLTMDDYPVNDYAQDRLFLGPATGREPAVAAGSAGYLATAMEQATASRVPLFTVADFAWNAKGYHPEESWRAAVDDLAGPDPAAREALGALAGNGTSSLLDPHGESAYLKPLLDAFWAGRARTGEGAAAAREKAGRELRAAFTVMRQAPARLKDTQGGALGTEAGPWLDRLARYGAAGEAAVDMLLAQARGEGATAWRAQLELERQRAGLRPGGVTVGKGVLDAFLTRAAKESAAWTGADRGPGGEPAAHRPTSTGAGADTGSGAGAGTGMGTGTDGAGAGSEGTAPGAGAVQTTDQAYTLRLDRSRPLDTLTVMTEPVEPAKPAAPAEPAKGSGDPEAGTKGTKGEKGSAEGSKAGTKAGTKGGGPVGVGRLEARVPGEGWRRLAPLAASGWTQADLKGLRADALRIVWTGPPGRVRSLVPWFADEPRAGLDLARTETDAESGGPAQRVDVTLTGRRASEVRGALTVRPPKGITVRLPKEPAREAVVPRGARTTVPLEVSVGADVPTGSYAVPVAFAGQERVLTVRAFPRTGGPDLARTAMAASSGDETPDFPAASALDGDPATRWSSPAEDGAWWQMELAAPARVGRLVLHWQDAYAAHYRVQVSADGSTWRTAATVADGRGGVESVRFDAPDTRFVRIQGDARATQYGYSLWSVEAYAVTEPDAG
ncbi:beta-N-acetylglucosaminidase domain-containing protein [Streptomyces sp. NPDC046203]|uniref:beta-N-acetylglucosaminidase domain-containing protein n=1 Tax=Streptomyces sp. NPDC046203 TaxID=3154602 RepID=UPI0033E18FC2